MLQHVVQSKDQGGERRAVGEIKTKKTLQQHIVLIDNGGDREEHNIKKNLLQVEEEDSSSDSDLEDHEDIASTEIKSRTNSVTRGGQDRLEVGLFPKPAPRRSLTVKPSKVRLYF